jgi:hypothetical protein
MPGFTPTRRSVRFGGMVSRRRDVEAGREDGEDVFLRGVELPRERERERLGILADGVSDCDSGADLGDGDGAVREGEAEEDAGVAERDCERVMRRVAVIPVVIVDTFCV